MTRRVQSCLVQSFMVLFFAILLQPSVQAATKTWNGSTDVNWSNAANWTGGLPVTGDDVVLTGAGANRPTNLDITVSLNSLTIDATATAAFTITATGANAITLTGTGTSLTVNTAAANHVLSIPIAIPATMTTWDIGTNRTLTVGNGTVGVISGAGRLIKIGAGTLSLRTANTYAGGTTITAGRVNVDADNRFGAVPGAVVVDHIILNGGGIQSGSVMTQSANRGITMQTVAGIMDITGGVYTYAGVIAGTVDLNKTGAGRLVLQNANTYTGATLINGGTLEAAADLALGTIGGNTQVNGGGTLSFSANYPSLEPVIINANNNNGAGRLESLKGPNTFSGNITINGTVVIQAQDLGLTLTGIISGSYGLIKQGTGPLTLQGANTYTGDTAIHSGTLRLDGGANRLPTATTVILGTESSGGQLDLNNQSQQLAGLVDARASDVTAVAPAAPNSILGLMYWLDASDTSTLFQDSVGATPVTANGQPVGLWRDKSGNNLHFSQATAGARPGFVAGTQASVRFDGLDDQLGLAVATSPVTVFIVNRMAPTAQNLAGIWGSSNPGDKGIRREDTKNVWRTADGNDFAFPERQVYINGTQTSDFGTIGSTHLLTAVRGSSAAANAATYNNTQLGFYVAARNYAGDIAEVVVYNRKLTDTERRSVESFLSAKWSVQVASSVVDSANDAVIPDLTVTVPAGTTNVFSGLLGLPNMAGFSFSKAGTGVFELSNASVHTGGTNVQAGVLRLTNNTAATTLPITAGLQQHFDATNAASFTMSTITPSAPNVLPGGGLALWLDASVAASITQAAGKVSQWNDLSGNARHFVQPTAASQPNYVLADTRIDGSNTLFMEHTATQILTGATGATVFVVGRNQPIPTGGGWGKFSADTNTVHTPWRDDARIYDSFASATRPELGFVGYNADTRFVYGAVQDGTAITAYYNSVMQKRATSAFAIPTTAQQRIFSQQGTFSMHEVIIFNRALTDAERKQVELYLANKWSVPQAATNSNISTWTSLTGPDAAKDLTQATVANQPVRLASSPNFAGKPVVLFDGNDVLSNLQNFSAGDSTVVTVQRMTRAQNNRLVTARSNNWLLGYHGGLDDRFHPNGWVSQSGGQSTPSGVAKIYTGLNQGGTNTFWSGMSYLAGNRNGTQGPNGLSLGAYQNNPASEASQGEIAEIVIYDRKLTTVELRRVVDYLQEKWLTPPSATRGSLSDTGVVAVSAGATLDLNNLSETIGPISAPVGGIVTLGSGSLTVNSVSNSTFSGEISGTGGLSKQGAGVLTLASANIYGGATTVTAGELNLTNATGSATSTGAVAVSGGAILSGTGSATGVVTLTNAVIRPGSGGTGTLTLGGLILSGTSVYEADLGTASDLIVVTGVLTVDGIINVSAAAGFAPGVFTVITYGGALTDNRLDLGTAPGGYAPSIISGNGQVVLGGATNVALSANPVSPTIYSVPMSFTATVTAMAPLTGVPSGPPVIFTVDGVAQPPVPIVNGTATFNLALLPVGTHTIGATFSASVGGSTVNLQHVVVKAQSTITLVSSTNPSPDGNGIITATIDNVLPAIVDPTSGTVTFTIDGQVTVVPVVGLQASVALPGLPSGVYNIDAVYSGDTEFLGSSTSLIQLVAPRFISLPVFSPNPALTGQQVTGTATAGTSTTTTWNWGDGTSSTGSSVTHVYSTPGNYTVVVTVSLSDGTSVSNSQQVFVGMGYDGPGGPGAGGATPPGVTGILVGGAGAGTAQGGKGKIVCNYVRRDKTNYSGSLGMLTLPSTLLQSDLTGQPSTLTIGNGTGAATFRFDLSKTGKGKATGLPLVEFNLKKKRFKFKAQREDLTALTEALGGPQQFEFNRKSPPVTLLVPVTLQIGNKIFLAMTFQVVYKQVSSSGSGSLAPQ